MKYPKVWGNGPATARVVGEARLRGLDQVGLPHLKASGPGFVAYKLGPTSEVHISGGEENALLIPYVLTHHAFSEGATTFIATIVGGERRPRYTVVGGFIDGNEWFDSSTRVVHVGGGYYASTALYQTEHGGDTSYPHYVFGFASRISGKRTISSELDADRFNNNVTFNAHVHYLDPGKAPSDPEFDPDHFPESNVSLSLFAGLLIYASGWDTVANAYRFGWGLWHTEMLNKFSAPDNSVHVRTYERLPVMYSTHTEQMQLSATPAAYFPNAFNHASQVFPMGPGRLGYLLLAQDYQPTAVTWLGEGDPVTYSIDTVTLAAAANPYLVVSNDHGQSWSTIEWSYLGDRIFKHKLAELVSKVGRQFRSIEVERDIARYAGIYYVGDGKSLIVVHRAMEDQASVNDDINGLVPTGPMRAMLFRYDAASPGVPTRLAWPADAWPVTANPHIATYSSNVMLRAFGLGCLALPMVSVTGTALLVTRDFGTSWEQVELFGVLPTGTSAEFVVTKAYVDETNAGEILFFFPSNGTEDDSRKGIHAYRTDGLFQEFKYIGRIAKNHDGHTVLSEAPFGKNGVYVGEHMRGVSGQVEYPPYINPAFPGEFDKP